MKSQPKSRMSYSVRTTSGRRQLQSLHARLRLQMKMITELEVRLYLQEAVLLVALHHLDCKSTTFHDDAQQTLH